MTIEKYIKSATAYLQMANHTNNNLDPEHTFHQLISAHQQILAALEICHQQWCEEYLAKHPAGGT